jgi:GDPmannose 4,6-dehydratase
VPEITAKDMCQEMVANDLAAAKRHSFLRQHGHDVQVALEGH